MIILCNYKIYLQYLKSNLILSSFYHYIYYYYYIWNNYYMALIKFLIDQTIVRAIVVNY